MITREHPGRWLLGLAISISLAPSALAKTIYVDDSAVGANYGAALKIVDCSFVGNFSEGDGGAMFNAADSTPRLEG